VLREPLMRFHDGAAQCWELCEDLVVTSREHTLVVPNGFTCDGASTPRAMWSLGFAPFELGFAPAFVHDWLYRHAGQITVRTASGDTTRTFTEEDADEFFLDLMAQCDIDVVKRDAAFAGVRAAGHSSWQPFPPSKA
jgi:hypothetical protein